MGVSEMIKKARDRAVSIREAMKSPAAQFFVSTEQRSVANDTALLLEAMADQIESEWGNDD